MPLHEHDDRAVSPEAAFVWWAALFGAALQGFWVVASIYIVVDVGLSALELLLLGTALEATILVAEVPTGVLADTVSRKWSMVVSMIVVAVAFVLTGQSSTFVALVIANILLGVGYTFASGADVAWITDELSHRGADEASIERALNRRARWHQRGGAAGLVAFGTLGWLTTLSIAIVCAGALLAGLAGWIGLLFSEEGFSPNRYRGLVEHRRASARILRSGIGLVRGNRIMIGLLAVTLLFNLGAEAMDRLTETRLIGLGLPSDVSPVLFFTALGLMGLLGGAWALKVAEPRIEGGDGPRKVCGAVSLLAATGALMVAVAPTAMIGAAGVFITRGLAWSVLPVVSSVWMNRHTDSESRATVQSFLGQATSAGQIAGGLLLGAIAAATRVPVAIGVSAALFTVSGLLILRSDTNKLLT